MTEKEWSAGSAQPQFVEGEIFRTVIPLKPVATEKVGPDIQVTTQVSTQVTTQVSISEKILEFYTTAKSKAEIMEFCGYKSIKNFTVRYINPLIESGQLKMTIPDKPKSQNQKYIKA